jgi:ABC-type Mn2+/Zn2+ transport system permease subunit
VIEAFLNDPPALIMAVGALVGVACSLLGVFLVLRKTAMLGDAISHAILLGIVVFFFVQEGLSDWGIDVGEGLSSPFLMLGAALAGLLIWMRMRCCWGRSPFPGWTCGKCGRCWCRGRWWCCRSSRC